MPEPVKWGSWIISAMMPDEVLAKAEQDVANTITKAAARLGGPRSDEMTKRLANLVILRDAITAEKARRSDVGI